jgi:hypothetical protein
VHSSQLLQCRSRLCANKKSIPLQFIRRINYGSEST